MALPPLHLHTFTRLHRRVCPCSHGVHCGCALAHHHPRTQRHCAATWPTAPHAPQRHTHPPAPPRHSTGAGAPAFPPSFLPSHLTVGRDGPREASKTLGAFQRPLLFTKLHAPRTHCQCQWHLPVAPGPCHGPSHYSLCHPLAASIMCTHIGWPWLPLLVCMCTHVLASPPL